MRAENKYMALIGVAELGGMVLEHAPECRLAVGLLSFAVNDYVSEGKTK